MVGLPEASPQRHDDHTSRNPAKEEMRSHAGTVTNSIVMWRSR
jgi:hypothetical protein